MSETCTHDDATIMIVQSEMELDLASNEEKDRNRSMASEFLQSLPDEVSAIQDLAREFRPYSAFMQSF